MATIGGLDIAARTPVLSVSGSRHNRRSPSKNVKHPSFGAPRRRSPRLRIITTVRRLPKAGPCQQGQSLGIDVVEQTFAGQPAWPRGRRCTNIQPRRLGGAGHSEFLLFLWQGANIGCWSTVGTAGSEAPGICGKSWASFSDRQAARPPPPLPRTAQQPTAEPRSADPELKSSMDGKTKRTHLRSWRILTAWNWATSIIAGTRRPHITPSRRFGNSSSGTAGW